MGAGAEDGGTVVPGASAAALSRFFFVLGRDCSAALAVHRAACQGHQNSSN